MKASKKKIESLLGMVSELEEQGVLSKGSSSAVASHYSEILAEKPNMNLLMMLFSIFGSLLIGAGIITLIAFNWHIFSKEIKTLFAFLPLILAQGICLFTFLKKKVSASWREGSTVFLMCSIAAEISLIGQIYQLGGDPYGLILGVLLLSLPVIYLFDSIAGATLYMFLSVFEINHPFLFLLVLALYFPFVYFKAKPDKYSPKSTILLTGSAISSFVCFISFFIAVDNAVSAVDGNTGHLIFRSTTIFIVLIFLLSSLYLSFEKEIHPEFKASYLIEKILAGDFATISSEHLVKKLSLSYLYATAYFLAAYGYFHEREDYSLRPFDLLKAVDDKISLVAASLLLFLCVIAICFFLYKAIKKNILSISDFLLIGISFISLFEIFFSGEFDSIPYVYYLFNVYFVVLCLALINDGIKKFNFHLASLGSGLLAIYLISKFMIIQSGLLVKGTLFILTGTGFLIANYFINKKIQTCKDLKAKGEEK